MEVKQVCMSLDSNCEISKQTILRSLYSSRLDLQVDVIGFCQNEISHCLQTMINGVDYEELSPPQATIFNSI